MDHQSVCHKSKIINIPGYETVTALQKRIDFLQNEIALRDAIIKMLTEMQTGVLDPSTNYFSR